MLTNTASYKHETPYRVPFVITQCLTNDTVKLQCGTTKLGMIYIELSHIHMIQTLKILTLKNMYDNVNFMITSYKSFVLILKPGTKHII